MGNSCSGRMPQFLPGIIHGIGRLIADSLVTSALVEEIEVLSRHRLADHRARRKCG